MKPAADMTIDEIAADIRQRLDANPAHAAALQPVADRLTQAMRDRLPYIDETEIGAVLVNLGAYITHALQLFSSGGIDPATTGQTVANVVAIAGAQMYGPGTTPTTNEQEHTMADQPTPEQLREFAARLVREAHVDYDFMGIGEQMSDAPELRDLDEMPFSEAQSAISDLISSAVVTVSWPDEPTTGEDWRYSANDIDNWWSDAPLTDRQLDVIKSDLNNELMPEDWRPHPQIARKLVAEVDRLRARLAEQLQDDDVRAVAEVLLAADHAASAPNKLASALGRLEARFGTRVRALEARDAKAGDER